MKTPLTMMAERSLPMIHRGGFLSEKQLTIVIFSSNNLLLLLPGCHF